MWWRKKRDRTKDLAYQIRLRAYRSEVERSFMSLLTTTTNPSLGLMCWYAKNDYSAHRKGIDPLDINSVIVTVLDDFNERGMLKILFFATNNNGHKIDIVFDNAQLVNIPG